MKKSLKKIIISSLIFATMMMFAVAGVLYTSANADGWSDIAEIKASYGDEITIPTRTYSVSDTEYDSTYVVTLPDGTKTSQEVITLSSAGIYKIKYTAVAGGKKVTETVSFKVDVPAYSSTNSETKVYYGDYTYVEGGETIAKVSGLIMDIQPGDTVTDEQLITIDNESTGYIKLFTFFVSPSKVGEADFLRTTFTLTDVEDPTCSLTISNGRSNGSDCYAYAGSYSMCKGTSSLGEQLLKGRQVLGTRVIIHTNNSYGTYVVGGSYYSVNVNGTTRTNYNAENASRALTYWFNPSENAVYVSVGTSISKTIVCDLDSNAYYGDATDVKWHGFTSGKVKLSVTPSEFSGSSAKIVFTDIIGADLQETVVEDNDAPSLTIYSDEYDKDFQMPDARVGYYYKIPEATAFDSVFGDTEVKVSVNKNGSANLVNIVDNAFYVDKANVNYTIVYTASDPFENEATITLKVRSSNTIDDIQIDMPSTQEYSYECTVGLETTLPTPKLSGGSGNLNLMVTYSFGGEEDYIDFDTLSFLPEYVGEYTITYKVTDYTGYEVTKEFTMNVVAATKPTYRVSSVTFPPVFISGFSYTLPVVYVYDYTSAELNIYESKVLVSYNGEDVTYTAGEEFIPNVNTTGDKIKIQYFSKYNDGESQIELEAVEVPVVIAYDENSKIQTQNYLYNENPNYTTDRDSDGILVTVSNDGDSSWSFANYLISNGFHLVLYTEINGEKFDNLVIKLTDSENPDSVLEFKIYKDLTNHYIDVVGGVTKDEISLVKRSNKTSQYSYDIKFINGKIMVNSMSYEIDQNFEGFGSGKAILTVTLENAKANTWYYVNEINSQVFSTISSDRTSPFISESEDYGGSKGINTTYYIYPKFSADVLSPVVNFTMTVYDPDGNIVSDFSGYKLQDVDPTVGYYVNLNKYGEYIIKYTSYDYKLNKNKVMVANSTIITEDIVTVVDSVAPTFTISSNVVTKAKVGEVIKLPTYTVSDNISDKDNISVMATFTSPTGIVQYISGDSFVCKYAGVYTLSMTFMDEAGNFTTKTFSITVSK